MLPLVRQDKVHIITTMQRGNSGKMLANGRNSRSYSHVDIPKYDDKSAADNLNDVETGKQNCIPVIRHMGPLLNSMRLSGLYFNRTDDDVGCAYVGGKTYSRCRPIVCYAAFVVAILWLNVARILTVFQRSDTFGPGLFGKLVVVIWMLLCAVMQTSYFVGSYTGSMDRVFELCQTTLTPYCGFYLRRMSTIYAVAAWTLSLLNGGFLAYVVFIVAGPNDPLLAPFGTHIYVDDLLPVRIVTFVIAGFFFSAWIFPQIMTFFIATIISHNFKLLDARLSSQLEASGGHVDGSDIEEIRKCHQDLCFVLSRADAFLKYSTAAAFCGQLAIVILLLYTLIFYPVAVKDPVVLTMNVFWLTGGVVGLSLTATSGIMVNQAAHRIFESVHCISLADLNSRAIGKVNVFLNRLTGDQIGFTVLGIFVVDKHTILTLLGLLITYFLLVVELSQPGDNISEQTFPPVGGADNTTSATVQ